MLSQSRKVYATVMEEMDHLTFCMPIQVRKMTFKNTFKSDLQQINSKKAMSGLGLMYDQFVDLCILLECNYCNTNRDRLTMTVETCVRV